MPKPRLLVLLNRLAVGGPATDLLSVLSGLSNDYIILLVAGEPDPDEQPADFLLEQYKGFETKKIYFLRRSVIPVNDVKAYYQVKQIIQEFKPDIVHTHGAKPGVLGRWAAHKLGVPVILHTFHGHVFHSYFNRFVSKRIVALERKLATISSAVIAINQKLQDELVNVYAVAPVQKVKLVKIGVENERFPDHEDVKRNRFRNEFYLKENTIAIGIAGRLVPVKNHSFFIEVAERVLKQSTNQQLKFFIVGDGAEKASIIRLLNEKKITHTQSGVLYNPSASVVFTSWRNDMDCVYAGLDLVLLTSLNEGTPVSLMEAMSAAKPIVSTNVGGVAELIEDGVTGFTSNSVEQMTKTVLQLVTSAELRKQTGIAAAAFARLHLSKQTEINELNSLYKQLLAENNR